MRETCAYAPARGKFRIYYIDEVHMLTAQAFNALLKTLEEPPPHVKFIFATTEPNKILPTIISRCQRFDLRRIPDDLIARHLLEIARLEAVSLEPEAADTIARGADGGMRDAQSMLDQLVSFCGSKIQVGDVLEIFGFTAQETVARLAGAILKKETAAALDMLQTQSDLGKDLGRLLAELIGHFRNLLVRKVDPSAGSGTAGTGASLDAQGRLVSTERLLNLVDQLAEVDARMKWAPNKKLYFEVGLIKAIRALEEVTLSDVIVTMRHAGHPGGGAGGPAADPAGETPAESQDAADQAAAGAAAAAPPDGRGGEGITARLAGAALWARVVAELQTKRPMLWGFATQGSVMDHGDDGIVIGFPPSAEIACESLRRQPAHSVVEQLLAGFGGRPVSLRLDVRGDVPEPANDTRNREPAASAVAPNSPPAREPSPASAEERFYADPLIAEALRLFEARITLVKSPAGQPAPGVG